nr:ribonuclease H-like domain-containing protein [Tanacetum cinerariifolium]
MASLADKAILSGADNRPPMLEKDMYDSWKSRMELYMLNRTHGRMILESVKQGPLIWPSVEVEGVTRLKKYSELSVAEAIQADCDVKATNIILKGGKPAIRDFQHQDLEQIHPDDLEEMDLKWQMDVLTMRARRFLKNTGRKLNLTGNDYVSFDKTKMECHNCHKRGHFARECQAPKGHNNRSQDVTRNTMPVETPNSSTLVSCDGLGGYDWSLQIL